MILVLLAACGRFNATDSSTSSSVVVTEVIEFEGATVVITRVITQTISITATPEPLAETAVLPNPVTLDLSFIANRPSIDPQKTSNDVAVDLMQNLFVGLTNYNHETNQIEPELARSWEVEANGRIWTFHLRDDVYWIRPSADTPKRGQLWSVDPLRPVNASDLVFAIQRACNRATDSPDAFILFIIEGCEQVYTTGATTAAALNSIGVQALDDVTLQFTLTKPASHFLTLTTLPLFHPIPQDIIAELEELEETAADWTSPENILTSGPYFPIPGGFSDTRIVLHRNPQWPLFSFGNVEIVNILFLNEDMDAYELWQDKGLDLSPLPDDVQEDFMEDTPLKAKLLLEQTVFYIGYNFDSSVFREPAMRRAFSAAIDREEFVSSLFGQAGLSMRHLTPPNVIAAVPVDEVGTGYSPDYARQELAASGFGSCRLIPPIRFLVNSADASLQRAELLRDIWADVLDCPHELIQIEQAQFGTLLANTRPEAGAARPDMWELGWASYFPDAQNWLGDLLHCVDSENRQNRPCSEVDNLIRQAASTTDPAAREALYRQIETLFFGRDGLEPITPLYIPGELIVVQNWLDFVPAGFGGEQYNTYNIDATLKELERSR
jgi:ABC-type oligopeptide transport system substrate-binding subunit